MYVIVLYVHKHYSAYPEQACQFGHFFNVIQKNNISRVNNTTISNSRVNNRIII